ncbi:4-carboxymuconolactone decarboxylase [Pelagibius sp. Alg239-R121]|uniref:4-carboxymuconolactone decarboxylase n=1 Tax=Pelagibius sp. Alg239-R121 TaxID=2993448 RepID=UPI0024A649B0|nr:4-carboxymuconolactone decarboxylase [Pelagibius sp. Alg239-R121]
MSENRYAQGMKTRRATLGERYVDGAEARKSPFDEAFQRFITEGAWGSVWSRDEITPRERSMVTIGLLAAMGHRDELELHLRATRNTGATMEDVKEVLLQVAVYAGAPPANTAIKIAKATYAALEAEEAAAAKEKQGGA